MGESRISKELHRRVFELTLALYRVTDFFPQGEVLRRNLREKANEIFGSISEYGYTQNGEHEAVSILARTQAVKGYLELARSMRFVKPINLTVLMREYALLEDFFTKDLDHLKNSPKSEEKAQPVINVEKEANEKQPEEQDIIEELPTWQEFKDNSEAVKAPRIIHTELTPISSDLNERQKKILEHLHQAPQAKISDFFSSFDEISSKTIQRDLQELVNKNLLKKEGEKRWTIYSLNNVQ